MPKAEVPQEKVGEILEALENWTSTQKGGQIVRVPGIASHFTSAGFISATLRTREVPNSLECHPNIAKALENTGLIFHRV